MYTVIKTSQNVFTPLEVTYQFNVYYFLSWAYTMGYDTVNVDIFACMNFRVFMKIGNFECIKIRVLIVSLGKYKSYFGGVHVFADI